MAKPILVINYCIQDTNKSTAVRQLKELKTLMGESDVREDYYIFIFPVKTESSVQVFYEKDFNEIKYKELKKIIEDKISLFENS